MYVCEFFIYAKQFKLLLCKVYSLVNVQFSFCRFPCNIISLSVVEKEKRGYCAGGPPLWDVNFTSGQGSFRA